ncbi:unnamed protein product [Gulo gulo]|uniref:Uncharacterized protein n=1 Tax=Gulo gulo TaxID=48420 RepID=A0A9X9PUE9_GULGU|nr:unnamed protein product [Gulo gulo]
MPREREELSNVPGVMRKAVVKD